MSSKNHKQALLSSTVSADVPSAIRELAANPKPPIAPNVQLSPSLAPPILNDHALYSMRQLCAIRNCSPATIYRELAKGIITAVKDGKNLRFKGRVIRERLEGLPEFVSRDAEALQRVSIRSAV